MNNGAKNKNLANAREGVPLGGHIRNSGIASNAVKWSAQETEQLGSKRASNGASKIAAAQSADNPLTQSTRTRASTSASQTVRCLSGFLSVPRKNRIRSEALLLGDQKYACLLFRAACGVSIVIWNDHRSGIAQFAFGSHSAARLLTLLVVLALVPLQIGVHKAAATNMVCFVGFGPWHRVVYCGTWCSADYPWGLQEGGRE